MEQDNLVSAVTVVVVEMTRRCGVLKDAIEISSDEQNQAYLKGQYDSIMWCMKSITEELNK